MTGSTFNVGAQTVMGALTWNANGAMQKMQITDPLNSADSQTCTYAHDDESRIAGANCGTAWAQTFSYDAFGNISKSGSISFLPTYSPTSNQISMLPGGFRPTYDANGNSLNDSFYQYVLDAENRAVKVDLVNVTYDALGRMVEQNRSGLYTELVYGPDGTKLALMNGQTLVKAFVGLPGNATAVYNSAGLAYYRHADWLGSSRLASTPARTMYSDTAYAPFGEPYAQAGTTDASFTGQNQDTVSGLYDFLAREYSSTQGRWTSPDPYRGSYEVANPQSMNRYAYVLNNPLSLVDPTGLRGVCFSYDVASWNPVTGDATDNWYFQCFDDGSGPSGGVGGGPIGGGGPGGGGPGGGVSTLPIVSRPIVIPPSNTSDQSSVLDHWPFNGNLLPLTPRLQDGVCTTGPFSNAMNSDPAVLSCCGAHDNCYAAHGCNATSWVPNPLSGGSCTMCNIKAAACISGALF